VGKDIADYKAKCLKAKNINGGGTYTQNLIKVEAFLRRNYLRSYTYNQVAKETGITVARSKRILEELERLPKAEVYGYKPRGIVVSSHINNFGNTGGISQVAESRVLASCSR